MYRYEETEDRREEKLAEGRGTGTGADYLAWIRPDEIASKGNQARQIEGRHMRPVLTVSRVETSFLDVADCTRRVKEIYDQFPLDRDETLAIAAELGVEHPRCKRSGTFLTMTTDFLLDYQAASDVIQVPVQCKHTQNLHDFNIAEHMEIERRFWARRGLKLRVATESYRCIPRVVRENCADLMQFRFLHKRPSEQQARLSFAQREELILCRVGEATDRATLNEVAAELATFTSTPIDKFTSTFLSLLYRRVLDFDMHKPQLLSHDVLDVQALTAASKKSRGEA